MSIIDDILNTLDFDTPLGDIRMGPFQTAVLTRACGLASTPHDPGPHHDKAPVADAGVLLAKDVKELAFMANSPGLYEASIGMAAINSLVEISDKDCVELNAGDLLMEKGEGKKVAIIGHFPFVSRLKKIARELWVIEKNPREGDVEESQTDNLVPQADVVGITGTAFSNQTIGHILDLCSSTAFVVILGGTTPLSPVLFDYGVDAVSGTQVIDSDSVLRAVSQGATFRQLKGIRLLTMIRQSNRL
jgi:uncharacterized protein (DUF4213/DUF364 family)